MGKREVDLKKVTGARVVRLKELWTHLTEAIEPGHYRKYTPTSRPLWLPERGTYNNNITVIARIDNGEPTEIDGATLQGPYFSILNIRDDRDSAEDVSTLHINKDYSTLGINGSGEVFLGSSRGHDHYCPVGTTAMGCIESECNLLGLPDTGPLEELKKRGLLQFASDPQVHGSDEEEEDA